MVLLFVGIGTVMLPQVAWAQTPANWTIVPSPNVRHAVGDPIVAVSCASPSACNAVGTRVFSKRTHTLILSWNGKRWRNVHSPNAMGADFLAGVSCSASLSCVAVGDVLENGADQTLIESWNGSAWSIVPSPNVSSTGLDSLVGVSCSSSSACIAVGQNLASTADQTLIESWNGSTWSIVPSPNSSATSSVLNGVSCNGPSACTSVGYDSDGNTLIESWNGSAWSIVPSPSLPPAVNALLEAVSCTSPSACTAVGSRFPPGHRITP